jgi:hypothetical protein
MSDQKKDAAEFMREQEVPDAPDAARELDAYRHNRARHTKRIAEYFRLAAGASEVP